LLHRHDEAGLAIGEEPSARTPGLSETQSRLLHLMIRVVHVVSEHPPPVKRGGKSSFYLTRPSASISYFEIGSVS
jgi:hypothetical protein